MYKWSDFKLRDKCNDCGELAKFKNFDGTCPKCGSSNLKQVKARFLYKRSPHLNNYHFKKVEVKDD